MNKYLLLRDNKQSGPYSVEELEKLGLKPYDLVWLDGRSAAWRYPSEIDELRHFAPAVEEQPYDRFYKKKTTQQAAAQQTINNVTQKETTQTEATVVTTPTTTSNIPQQITAKKIYVTLPAGTGSRNNTTTITATNNSKTEQAKTPTAEQEANATLLNEKFARLRDEKIKQAEEMAANPAIDNKATVTQTTIPVAGFSEIVEQHRPQQQETLAPAHLRSNNSKLLMRSIVAACLVLGGIIIGLVISNSRHQKNSEALDQIVKKIQEREKRMQLATQAVSVSTQSDITANDPGAVSQQEPPAAPTGNKQELADQPANAPAKKITPATKEIQPAKDEQQESVKIIPAVVTNKPEEKPVNHQEIEKARRNIHQLVAVDANKYKTGVLGGISELKLTLSNNSLYPLDEVEIEVRYLGPEKRVVKTQLLRFSDVAAGEQKTVEAPRTNRGVTVDYAITRINSKALGLAHAGH